MCKIHHLLRACGWSVAASFACTPGDLDSERRMLGPDAAPEEKDAALI
jgi:hypothetical protein